MKTTTSATTQPAEVLTERDAARYIAMSVHYLRQRRVHGGGPSFLRFGRSIRYELRDLEAWLAGHRVVREQ
jgi:hypothetical protein